ncbi:hypothetical protein IQ288_34655 [Burkholderia sp. R-69980]|jgi:hypothetical protein|nr:hypothetical protein [Burkholderia sp. R-69980]
MSGLDAVLQEFKNDVERAEHLLSLVKSFRDFGASTPPDRERGTDDPWKPATVLHEASKQRRTDLPILSGSLQLYLAGRFEYCIRQVVEVVADEIASRAATYSDLPAAIRKELKARTLEIAHDPKRYGYDESQSDTLLASLVSNFQSGASSVSINSAVLSITDSNMKERMLADILKRVGMSDFWKDVGKQTSVKLALERTIDGEATVEAQSRLNAIMEERNQVAHPTSATSFPDPDQVLSAARFLKTLATTTVELAKVYLTGYKPNGSSQ